MIHSVLPILGENGERGEIIDNFLQKYICNHHLKRTNLKRMKYMSLNVNTEEDWQRVVVLNSISLSHDISYGAAWYLSISRFKSIDDSFH